VTRAKRKGQVGQSIQSSVVKTIDDRVGRDCKTNRNRTPNVGDGFLESALDAAKAFVTGR
jgi:hypothetical protein